MSSGILQKIIGTLVFLGVVTKTLGISFGNQGVATTPTGHHNTDLPHQEHDRETLETDDPTTHIVVPTGGPETTTHKMVTTYVHSDTTEHDMDNKHVSHHEGDRKTLQTDDHTTHIVDLNGGSGPTPYETFTTSVHGHSTETVHGNRWETMRVHSTPGISHQTVSIEGVVTGDNTHDGGYVGTETNEKTTVYVTATTELVSKDGNKEEIMVTTTFDPLVGNEEVTQSTSGGLKSTMVYSYEKTTGPTTQNPIEKEDVHTTYNNVVGISNDITEISTTQTSIERERDPINGHSEGGDGTYGNLTGISNENGHIDENSSEFIGSGGDIQGHSSMSVTFPNGVTIDGIRDNVGPLSPEGILLTNTPSTEINDLVESILPQSTPSFREATSQGPPRELKEWEIECCYTLECQSVFGPRSRCTPSRHQTDKRCSPESAVSPREKRELGERWTTPGEFPERTGVGLCTCEEGFVEVNSKCVFDSNITCCLDMECVLLLGDMVFCNLTHGDNNGELCGTDIDDRPKREIGNTLLNRQNTETVPILPRLKGKCAFTASWTGQMSPGAAVLDSMRDVCDEKNCTGGTCQPLLRKPDWQKCSLGIDNLKCYVIKLCTDDKPSFIFSCEDKCSSLDDGGTGMCFSAYCTTVGCNNNTVLVDGFSCNTCSGLESVSLFVALIPFLLLLNCFFVHEKHA